MSLAARHRLVEQGRMVISLAWEIGSGLDHEPGLLITNPDRYNATVQNGLMALAMVEVMATPGDPSMPIYSPVRLRDVLDWAWKRQGRGESDED